MIHYTRLSHEALVYLLFKYNQYIQELNEDPERGQPVSVDEFLNNDFIEILNDEGLVLGKLPVGTNYHIKDIR